MSPDNATEAATACSLQEGRTLTAHVDLGQLARNLAGLRRVSRELGLLAVVKADAYGHGAVPVARALESAGIEGFCVATLPEALDLRRGGILSPILVLGSIRPESLPVASANHLDLTVVSADHLLELAPLVPEHPVGLHLKLDTGMGRSGILLDDLGACLDGIRALQPRIRGVMGHFSASEAPDARCAHLQRKRFQGALAQLRDAGIAVPMAHHANSAGCLRGFVEGDTHARCGIALYGLSEVEEAREAGLKPILELTAEVMRAVRIPAGSTVGYGSTYVAPHPVKLVTLNCGYADGYPRALSNRAQAGFKGRTYPVVGQVSMDMLTVVLPEAISIRPGDRMTLLSRNPEDPHSVQATARLLSTIPYEVTCALNRRVLRDPT
ncbi:MAG: alanine racemase [Geothrix sp.]|nr:alanine racemase [Geothrix sp.]